MACFDALYVEKLITRTTVTLASGGSDPVKINKRFLSAVQVLQLTGNIPARTLGTPEILDTLKNAGEVVPVQVSIRISQEEAYLRLHPGLDVLQRSLQQTC